MGSGKAVEPDDDPILDAAGAVADGLAVDWNHLANGSSEPDDRSLIEQLQLISKIAGAHRTSDDVLEPASNTPGATAVEERAGGPAAGVGEWGGLILIEQVGEGSFGTVYRAYDPQLDRAIAVKLLRQSSATEDLLREARLLAKVRHPNVVMVHGAGIYDGRAGLWMEFLRGVTLEQMLVSHGPFSAGEAALVAHELCGALAAVHHAGLVHRDVKTQNVMREEGGRLVLMDFGAGQKQSEHGAAGGRVVGTPLYVAPEVLAGGPATTRSDVYSLGVLLYHLMTNDFPVRAATFKDLAVAHARRQTVPLNDARPRLPAPFVRVVERAIARNPARRYESAGRFQAALARISDLSISKTAVPRIRTTPGRTRSAVAETGGVTPNVASVAVLPFTDMSAAKDQDYFCDGMTEELINGLTQIPGLRVAARTSAFQFKGQAQDVREIGDALNVATVLDGSVRKDGNRLRVTVELIGTLDGYHLWSQQFDRKVEDVFEVQAEIAASVVGTLKGRLAADTIGAALAPRNRDLRAYGFYLEGRYHWNKRTEDELKRSLQCFEQAVHQDPHYAEAYAAIADAYVTLGTYGTIPSKEVMPRAKDAVEKALGIDAGLAEAYTCRGCVRSVYDWSWSQAERDFRRAIDLNPSYPTAHHWYAINHLVPLGRFDEATRELNLALEIDPLALAIKTSLGMKSYFSGRYDDAVRELSKTIELDESFGMAHFFLGATYTELARYPEARVEIEMAIRLSGRSPEILAALGYLQAVSGDVDAARAIQHELMELESERYVSPARLAQVHVGLNETPQALERLEEACADRAADLAWLAVRPVFARLRAEPRFTRVRRRMRLAAH